jgi:DnaJ-class molecular chaperone
MMPEQSFKERMSILHKEHSAKMLRMHEMFMEEEKRLLEVYECPTCKGSGVVIESSFFGLIKREVKCPRCLGTGSDWQAFERDKALGRWKPPNLLGDD